MTRPRSTPEQINAAKLKQATLQVANRAALKARVVGGDKVAITQNLLNSGKKATLLVANRAALKARVVGGDKVAITQNSLNLHRKVAYWAW